MAHHVCHSTGANVHAASPRRALLTPAQGPPARLQAASLLQEAILSKGDGRPGIAADERAQSSNLPAHYCKRKILGEPIAFWNLPWIPHDKPVLRVSRRCGCKPPKAENQYRPACLVNQQTNCIRLLNCKHLISSRFPVRNNLPSLLVPFINGYKQLVSDSN